MEICCELNEKKNEFSYGIYHYHYCNYHHYQHQILSNAFTIFSDGFSPSTTFNWKVKKFI